MTRQRIELGHNHSITFTRWGEHERAGLIQDHQRPDGSECDGGAVLFDLPGVREAFPERAVWRVESWNPLTLSPSLLCAQCGDHGFIRNGRWEPA